MQYWPLMSDVYSFVNKKQLNPQIDLQINNQWITDKQVCTLMQLKDLTDLTGPFEPMCALLSYTQLSYCVQCRVYNTNLSQ